MEENLCYLRAVHQYGYRWGKENGHIIGMRWDKEKSRAVVQLLFMSDYMVDYVPLVSIENGDFQITSSKDPWPATD